MLKSVFVDWDITNRKQLVSNPTKTKKVLAFIQARETSSRFPRKIYEDLNGAPLIFHTIARAKEASLIGEVFVISPHNIDCPEGIKNIVVEGDENDVLSRFSACLAFHECDYVVRLTSDCPLLDPYLIDFVIHTGISRDADYCSNVLKLTFPDGLDCELISSSFLRLLHQSEHSLYNREHCTTRVRDDPTFQDRFNLVSVESTKDYSGIKLSVDTPDDLNRLRQLEKGAYQ